MRLRIVELPDDSYLVVIDRAGTAYHPDSMKAVGEAAEQRSGGKCHGVLFFPDAVNLPNTYEGWKYPAIPVPHGSTCDE